MSSYSNPSPATQEMARNVLLKMLNEGKSLKDAMQISDSLLEQVYSLAYSYYQVGKYKDAGALFQFLAGTSPKTFKYVYGLASCQHQQKDYENASFGFFIASELEQQNPLPIYYIADSFYQLGHFEGALEYFNLVAQMTKNQPKWASLREQCLLISKTCEIK